MTFDVWDHGQMSKRLPVPRSYQWRQARYPNVPSYQVQFCSHDALLEVQFPSHSCPKQVLGSIGIPISDAGGSNTKCSIILVAP